MTIPMLGLHVLHLAIRRIKVPIALSTVMMFRAVGVVLVETLLARKVHVATLAQPVTVRVLHVLLVRPIMREISLTTIAVSHPRELWEGWW
jgi:hypothetical protein